MKKSKKILTLFMALMILFSSIPMNVHAGGWMPGDMGDADPEDYGLHSYKDFVYDEDKGNGVVIIDYIGKKTTVTVPAKIKGKKVISIWGYGKIKNLHVPNGIKIYDIGYSDYLKRVTVNKSNKDYSVKNNMLLNKKGTILYWCPRNIVSPKIPKTVKTIESEAFICSKSRKITIPENVRTIEERAFPYCKNLEEIKFGKGIKTIKSMVFVECISLKSVTIPDSVRRIEGGAFYGCKRLRNVKLSNNLKNFYPAFYLCNIKKIEMPKSVTLADLSYLDELKKVYIYNKDCKIEYEKDYPPEDIVVYGYKGSTAEKFAKKTGNKFIVLK